MVDALPPPPPELVLVTMRRRVSGVETPLLPPTPLETSVWISRQAEERDFRIAAAAAEEGERSGVKAPRLLKLLVSRGVGGGAAPLAAAGVGGGFSRTSSSSGSGNLSARQSCCHCGLVQCEIDVGGDRIR